LADLQCGICQAEYPLTQLIYRCPRCDYPLEVRYPAEGRRRAFLKGLEDGSPTLWRYHGLLPVRQPSQVVSLGEGGTPLVKSTRLAGHLKLDWLYFKDESRNPTGSFKDRGTSVGVSLAHALKAPAVGCVSTGNMAHSLAAYAARAGLPALLLVPARTPPGKVLPMLAHGARVILMDRPYPEVFRAGFDLSREFGIHWLHSDAPFRIDGQKTAAFEIWEQLGQRAPDWVFVPTSSGGNLSALWKGFQELFVLGLADHVPALVAVQAKGASPIVRAFREGRESVASFKSARTHAHAIANPDPPSGRRVLRILAESAGAAVAVTDVELRSAQSSLARREGLLVELAAAAGFAGLGKMAAFGLVRQGDVSVCLLTGSGLKDLAVLRRDTSEPLRPGSWADCKKAVREIIRRASA
jgi:threonine synthase